MYSLKIWQTYYNVRDLIAQLNEFFFFLLKVSTDETVMGQVIELTVEKVLELIESAYPNPVTVVDVAK